MAPPSRQSIPWAFLTTALIALLSLHYYAENATRESAVTRVYQRLLHVAAPLPARDPNWGFPVAIGDRKRVVLQTFGDPERISDRNYWYPASGVWVSFDFFGTVVKLRFEATAGSTYWKDPKRHIGWGIRPTMTSSQLRSILKEPAINNVDAESEIFVWLRDAHQISAIVSAREHRQAGQTFRQGAVKSIEISPAK